MKPEEVGARLEAVGQPRYRTDQVYAAIHRRGVSEWEAVNELSRHLRATLAEAGPLRSLMPALHRHSALDGTTKVLFRCHDGALVESVLMTSGDRKTVCVSSQVGCPAACTFCASGLGGLTRNLTGAEIADQVEFFAGLLHPAGETISNVVFMGMGEPFLNYDRVMEAVATLRDPRGLGLGARRFTISTVGIVPGIRRFVDDGGSLNLAVSLHAPNDAIRSSLVPYNKHFPIGDILGVVRQYVDKTHRRVSFEYVLLAGTNDQLSMATELGRLLRPFGQYAHVNLIPWNPFPEKPFDRSKAAVATAFAQEVRRSGVNATIRYSKGLDIEAACGQLRRARETSSPEAFAQTGN
jgi:23S rRNA (adenine2503-C2)-methyltransferase